MAGDSRTGKDKATIVDKVIEPLKAAGEAIKDAGQKAAENSAALSSAVIDHAEANTREAFAALRAAAQASSINDVLRIQGDFVREAGSRGMAQAKEIGELVARFGKDTVAGLTGRKSE